MIPDEYDETQAMKYRFGYRAI